MLAPLVAARPGLRVPGAWDGFELAVRAVLGQQITVTRRGELAGKLVAAYGEPLADGQRRRATGSRTSFPRPERLAAPICPRLGMPRARAAALPSLAAARSPIRSSSARDGASTGGPRSCARSPASASGRRSTSPCARCASPMRSPPPTSACCARWPMARTAAEPRASCSPAPSAGGRGAPTPRSTCGAGRRRRCVRDEPFPDLRHDLPPLIAAWPPRRCQLEGIRAATDRIRSARPPSERERSRRCLPHPW